jgi:hypothetical protein
MPATSQAQRGFLAHKFGPAWMKKHHFDNKGKLPAHVKNRRKTKMLNHQLWSGKAVK